MGRVAKQPWGLQPMGAQEAVGSLTGSLFAHSFRKEEASITCQSPREGGADKPGCIQGHPTSPMHWPQPILFSYQFSKCSGT